MQLRGGAAAAAGRNSSSSYTPADQCSQQQEQEHEHEQEKNKKNNQKDNQENKNYNKKKKNKTGSSGAPQIALDPPDPELIPADHAVPVRVQAKHQRLLRTMAQPGWFVSTPQSAGPCWTWLWRQRAPPGSKTVEKTAAN